MQMHSHSDQILLVIAKLLYVYEAAEAMIDISNVRDIFILE